MSDLKTEWSPAELRDIAVWAKDQGGNVAQAAANFLKSEARLKSELVLIAKQTRVWTAQLSGELMQPQP